MKDKIDASNLREYYKLSTLDAHDMLVNPFDQFKVWFKIAVESGIKEANAMTLATVSKGGFPSARIVLLKEFNNDGLIFYTNYKSKKAVEILDTKKVACVFLWKELERQVRIEGTAQKIPISKSKAYFKTRPKGSQIGAWVSPQSEAIESRSILEKRKMEIERKFKEEASLPLPKDWGGFEIQPTAFEFWQGRENRLHDRFKYLKEGEKWQLSRLAP